jgi:hypothetical protein
MLTTKPIDRRARTEEAEETVEAEVVSTSPSVHVVRKVVKRRGEGERRSGKGANPDRLCVFSVCCADW